MTFKIYPGKLKGTVAAPPSKSMAHRHIIAASLAEGKSHLENISFSDDIKATLGCVAALGAEVKICGSGAEITGFDIFESKPRGELFANESGSTLRFLIPLCLLSGETVTLTGKGRLFERPLGIYEKLCMEHGMFFERKTDRLTLRGSLTPGIYEVPGGVSSQFISGMLFALPLLGGDSVIKITGKLESAPYLMMTLQTLAERGIKTDYNGADLIKIPGSQKYKNRDAVIEGDYSNAAFFDALNLLGNGVTVTGLCENSLQGDKIYKKYFDLLGKEPINLEDCPDLAPILFTAASCLGGAEFTGTRRLKLKESDRGEAMAEELAKFGAEVQIRENSVTVRANELRSPTVSLDSHGDHRIVMSLAVLCTKYGGIIENCEAAAKSMPDFFEKLVSLGAVIERL